MSRVRFILLVFFCIGCFNRPAKNTVERPIVFQSLLDPNFHKKRFDSLLSIICKDTSGIEFSGGLLANPIFRIICEHSAAYLPDVAELPLDGHFNTMQANVCIFSMQNLCA